jgi:DNA-nicking Smr family endonuclease
MHYRTMATDPDDDAAAFFKEVKDVAPIRAKQRVAPAPKQPPPVPVQSARDEREALADSLSDAVADEIRLEIGEELSWRRDGIPHDTLRRLRRGEWALQDQLDLHGLTVEDARALLAAFLNGSVKRGLRCIRIVHGKGLRSASGEPVLKRKVAGWLAQRDEVLAYVQARAEDGGGGAVMVLLRGTRKGRSTAD